MSSPSSPFPGAAVAAATAERLNRDAMDNLLRDLVRTVEDGSTRLSGGLAEALSALRADQLGLIREVRALQADNRAELDRLATRLGGLGQAPVTAQAPAAAPAAPAAPPAAGGGTAVQIITGADGGISGARLALGEGGVLQLSAARTQVGSTVTYAFRAESWRGQPLTFTIALRRSIIELSLLGRSLSLERYDGPVPAPAAPPPAPAATAAAAATSTAAAAPPPAPPTMPAPPVAPKDQAAPKPTAKPLPPCLVCDWTGAETPSVLYRLDPNTGEATKIGPIGNWTVVDLLGKDPSRGILYGLGARESKAHLLRIDPATGAVQATLELPRWVSALTDHREMLYGVGNGFLLQIDPDTRRIEEIKLKGEGPRTIGPLLFAEGDDGLATVLVDGKTALAAVRFGDRAVRVIGPIGFEQINSLELLNDQLHGVTDGGRLIRIDPQTGRGQAVLVTDSAHHWGGVTRWV